MKRAMLKLAMLGLLALIATACGGTQVKGGDPRRTELDDARDAYVKAPADQKVREHYKVATVSQEAAWLAVAQDAVQAAVQVRAERCKLTHLAADCQPVEPSTHVGIRIESWSLKGVQRLTGNWPVWVDSGRVVIFDPADPTLMRATTVTPAVLTHLPSCILVNRDGDWTVQQCASPAPAPAASGPNNQ